MTSSNETASHEAVRRCVIAALRDPAGIARLTAGELDLTLRLMRRAQLLGRLAWHVRAAGVHEQLPRTARDALVGALRIAEAKAHEARWELDRVVWALRDEAQVPLIAMKGCAYLMTGTPNASGRLFADVDLLVPEADLARVESRLVAHGWRGAEVTPYDDNYYRLWTHELPPMSHVEREVEIDLHHNVLMRTARFKPDASLLLANARALSGTGLAVLAPTDMVLHAMTHLFAGSEMPDALRELVDIQDLLRHFGAHEAGFWERFWPRAVQLDLARPAFYGLRYAKQLLDAPIPAEVLRASQSARPPAPVLWLMDRLVPRALFPQHPDRHSHATSFARSLLFVRVHWLRMPPPMLARHLSYKFWRRLIQPREPSSA